MKLRHLVAGLLTAGLAFAGDPVTITWDVRNLGSGTTGDGTPGTGHDREQRWHESQAWIFRGPSGSRSG